MSEYECDLRIEAALKVLRKHMQTEHLFWAKRGHVNQAAAVASVVAAIDDTITEILHKPENTNT